jgi:hypothetical protein
MPVFVRATLMYYGMVKPLPPQHYMCTQLLLQAVVVSPASTKVLLASFFPLSALAPVQDVSGGAQTHLDACPYML